MAELGAREAKLVQYLNEAYGLEKQLETALTAHLTMAQRDNYKKRLKQHLKETKAHGRSVQKRIKALGGKAETVDLPVPEVAAEALGRVTEVASRAAAAAQGPLHALRGTGAAEKQLKNVKTEFASEAEEIATYTAIEALAEGLGDTETAKLARQIRREEERMASFLEKLMPQLTKEVVREEIPAKERKRASRNGSRAKRASSSKRASSGKRRAKATA
jgi:ferritin-like metal-binding protein YciE